MNKRRETMTTKDETSEGERTRDREKEKEREKLRKRVRGGRMRSSSPTTRFQPASSFIL